MPLKVMENPALRNRIRVFRDRIHAGALLARELQGDVGRGDLILALPAGGVPVGCAVAEGLGIPLDVLVVRKIQVPWSPEAGFGAVAWDGSVILNEALLAELGLSSRQVEEFISQTRRVVFDRVKKFRGGRPLPNLQGSVTIVVDDGLASGYTMAAAVNSLRKLKAREIIVAVPTGSKEAVRFISSKADLLLCLNIRESPVFAVADAYETWHDLSDEEVIRLLREAKLFASQ